MSNKTILQKTVSKQRKALKRLLSQSIAEVATACSVIMHDRHALEDLLSKEMSKAKYCKYVWVLDKTGRQLTDNVKRTGIKKGQVGRDRMARPYLQRAFNGKDYYLSEAYISRNRKRPSITAVKRIYDEDGEAMSRVGQEFGATTGRPRRCGWLDLVALKYACQVNGVTQLMMMKGDVLSGFKTLKVCTSYKYKGEEITHLPYNIEPENVQPVYTDFKGWKEDLTEMTDASQFPKELNDYILIM